MTITDPGAQENRANGLLATTQSAQLSTRVRVKSFDSLSVSGVGKESQIKAFLNRLAVLTSDRRQSLAAHVLMVLDHHL